MSRRPETSRPGQDGAVTPSAFWEEPGGLDLAVARLLPGGRVLEYRFRGGQAYRLDLAALGFAEPGLFAALDPKGRGVVLGLGASELVDVATNRLLAASEPAYQVAIRRAAAAPERVGARIRTRRVAAGRTAMEVAEAAGMARSNYARLEASRHRPRLDTLERVAAALGVRVAELLGGMQ